MDFSTMRQKLADYEYVNFDLFESDFNLIIRNCLDFNQEDTVFYRAALRMRAHCRPILKLARKRIRQAGIDPETGMHMAKPQLIDVDCGSPTEDGKSVVMLFSFIIRLSFNAPKYECLSLHRNQSIDFLSNSVDWFQHLCWSLDSKTGVFLWNSRNL